ncbi:MAG: NAD-dependent epimerase/dehydratase family protein [Sphingomicrobium sp.]
MRFILLGGRGILGSAFRTQLERRGADVALVRPPWGAAAEAATFVRSELSRLLGRCGPTTLIWAAGVGHVGASAGELEAETAGLEAAAEALRALAPAAAAATTVLFSSSAGAIFAGAEGIIDEQSEPCPVAPYGREKLRQEQLLRRVSRETGARVIACRISNLYGLADGRLTARGLISIAVRCTRLRQPMTVFVSPDTRRDYLLSSDAATLALQQLDSAQPGFSTALIREGRSRTIAEVLGLIGSVARRRVPAVYAERPESRLQPRSLRFSAPVALPGNTRLTPMETGIARMVMAPLAV